MTFKDILGLLVGFCMVLALALIGGAP